MSQIFNRIKDLIGPNPINSERKARIEELVKENMEEYKKNYNEEFKSISEARAKEGIELVFEEIDQEAKKQAGLDIIKENITEQACNELLPEIESELPEQGKVTGTKVAEKGIEKVVHASVDKIAKELEKRNKDDLKEKKQKIDKQYAKVEDKIEDLKEPEEDKVPQTRMIETDFPEVNVKLEAAVGPTRDPLMLAIDPKESIKKVKQKISEEFGIDVEEFHLSYAGRTMDEKYDLAYYNVKDGDPILLIPISTAGKY